MLEELERRRAELMREFHAVGAAIKAYVQTISNSGEVEDTNKVAAKVAKRPMSAATKRKLSLAAKQRWAKVNANGSISHTGEVKENTKKAGAKVAKRPMSAATKRKLSLAAKQRWAKVNAKKG